jgi:hypothetical protein
MPGGIEVNWFAFKQCRLAKIWVKYQWANGLRWEQQCHFAISLSSVGPKDQFYARPGLARQGSEWFVARVDSFAVSEKVDVACLNPIGQPNRGERSVSYPRRPVINLNTPNKSQLSGIMVYFDANWHIRKLGAKCVRQ